MRTVKRTVCDPNCHANPKCGISATIEDGRITSIGAAKYPKPGLEKRICMMGSSRLDYQYHPDRLKTPLKRSGPRGSGQWEAISWDEAVQLFVKNQRAVTEKYGSRAVMFSSYTGAFALLTRGAASRYAALTGGTVGLPSGIDYGVPTGLQYMFGVPAYTYFAPGSHQFADMANSEVSILWGINPVVTRSVDHLPIKAARKSGTKLICIDPVYSESAKLCDEHISLRPGTDGALALALAHHLIDNGLIDEEFLINHTDMPFLLQDYESKQVWCRTQDKAVSLDKAKTPALTGSGGHLTVFDAFKDMASAYTLPVAAEITGIPEDVIEALADAYAKAKPASIRLGYGIDRWFYSDCTARAIAALACLSGNIGIPGGGVSLSNSPPSVPVRGSAFYAPEGHTPGGALTMMDVDKAVRTGKPYPIKMECISLGNPFNQLKPGRTDILSEYIPNLDFLVVIDHFMTDTAKQADLVLPACTIFERTDIVVDSILQLQQRMVEPVGEAKSDFEIFALLAEAMGKGEWFSGSPEDYIAKMLNVDDPKMADVTVERLLKEEVIDVHKRTEPWYGFADRKFPTASGRVEFYKPDQAPYGSELPVYREPIEASPKNPLFKKYPLVLLSAHSRYRIHSTFANMPSILAREPEPIMRMSPQDAIKRDLEDGAIAKVQNDRGTLKIKCKVDDAIRPGAILVSEGHWTEQFIEGDPYVLTHDRYSETAQNYAHYDVLVEVSAA
ncbi:MAG: molybdopterin-dependent oxidoreductase [Pseudomonadota bacterium]